MTLKSVETVEDLGTLIIQLVAISKKLSELDVKILNARDIAIARTHLETAELFLMRAGKKIDLKSFEFLERENL